MNTTENGTTPTEAITWTKKREWGSQGYTYRAVIQLPVSLDEIRLVVYKPGGQHHWVAQAWVDGNHAMHRDGHTLADVKDQAARWLAAYPKGDQ